jgi:FAD/FMN-containing dehydrogenase
MVTPANTPDIGSVHTSVTPAWRSAALHVVIGLGWSSTATAAEVQGNLTALTNLTQYLTAVLPGSTGAYWNEADYLQADWQDTFWGTENYARLQGIKKDVDPLGVFTCHHCVELPSA